MENIENTFELRYYQTVCQIQDDCIKEKITKEECERKLEIERLKYISYLRMQNRQLIAQMEHEEKMRKALSEFDKELLKYYGEDNSPNRILLLEKKISRMTHNIALWLEKERKEREK